MLTETVLRWSAILFFILCSFLPAQALFAKGKLPNAQSGIATWYAYKKCDCAASTVYPKGTYLVVSLASDSSKSVTVRVNDYGPNRKKHPERIIDLDKTAFKKIAPLSMGMVAVNVQLLQ